MGRRGKRNDARPVPTPEVPPAPAEAAAPDQEPDPAPVEPAPARKRFRVRLPGVEALTVEADDEAGAFAEYKRRLGITGTVHRPEIALET